MDIYEVIGRVVVWLFLVGAGLFAITVTAGLVIGIIGSVLKRK